MSGKRKLLLVNAVNPNRHGLHNHRNFRFPPLSLGIVGALTPKSWEVTLVDENWEAFRYSLSRKSDVAQGCRIRDRRREMEKVCRKCSSVTHTVRCGPQK